MQKRYELNKQAIARAFSHAAGSYDQAAIIQNEIASRLIERLDYIQLQPVNILDIGCGTGRITGLLRDKFPNANIFAIDLSLGMIKKSQQAHASITLSNADMEYLPFRDQAFDLIFTCSTIQWANQPQLLFQELHRCLKRQGLLLFATFGPDTLFELKTSWENANHVHDFVDMHHYGDLMAEAQFCDPVVDMEKITVHYPDVTHLLSDIKATGAHNQRSDRQTGLQGKKAYQKMIANYQQNYAVDNSIPATYEVIYGHAWGAEYRQMRVDDEVHIPLSSIKGLPL